MTVPRPRSAWLLLIAAIIISIVLINPYLRLDIDDSRLDMSGNLHYSLLVAHIFTAAVAIVLGPLQFMSTVRARRTLHRTIGRAYLLAGVLPSAVTAIPVALWSGRIVTQIGLVIAAALWLITGGLAYRAARRRDFIGHRDWMMRNYALTFLAVTSRILTPLLLLAQSPFIGDGAGPVEERVQALIPVGQTLGWIVNLVVAESLIRRRPRDSGMHTNAGNGTARW
ncbi:DUF2306 domain-containing protein [Micromonospora rubida]|uniref:DUF2306 domain-containing protein n=1 Tax=Micromonospora rubida TaxID=2697657 RepID=UPI001377AF8F|nr:DUF2306 domain-containing protein [Micromonospora rubida]NBE85395.1 DUF2306 domain-containing protein [Micromonospora rubida]